MSSQETHYDLIFQAYKAGDKEGARMLIEKLAPAPAVSAAPLPPGQAVAAQIEANMAAIDALPGRMVRRHNVEIRVSPDSLAGREAIVRGTLVSEGTRDGEEWDLADGTRGPGFKVMRLDAVDVSNVEEVALPVCTAAAEPYLAEARRRGDSRRLDEVKAAIMSPQGVGSSVGVKGIIWQAWRDAIRSCVGRCLDRLPANVKILGEEGEAVQAAKWSPANHLIAPATAGGSIERLRDAVRITVK